MDVGFTHEDDVEVECPHCRKWFAYHYKGEAWVELEPPPGNEGRG